MPTSKGRASHQATGIQGCSKELLSREASKLLKMVGLMSIFIPANSHVDAETHLLECEGSGGFGLAFYKHSPAGVCASNLCRQAPATGHVPLSHDPQAGHTSGDSLPCDRSQLTMLSSSLVDSGKRHGASSACRDLGGQGPCLDNSTERKQVLSLIQGGSCQVRPFLSLQYSGI